MSDHTPAMATEIIKFWFDAGPKKWWIKDKEFDQTITDRFSGVHKAARTGACDDWAETAEGSLALTLVLDQFSRNMFRNDPRAFAQDEQARNIARHAIGNGFDQAFPVARRAFFYLPFMHHEDLASQDYCVSLYRAAGDENGLVHAQEHAEIIRRFGRFPHRNEVLGRFTSPAEQAFLDAGGFSG